MAVIIPDKNQLQRTIEAMRADGVDRLHVLADFDRTLTYGSVNGVKTPSIISILRNGRYLKPGYDKKAHALFDKYNTIELDPKVPLKEKKQAMDTWWRTHKQLLIASGLNKTDLEEIVKDPLIKFRKGVDKFLDFLKQKNIPLVILSASGVGEALPLYFKNAKKNYNNIYFLINSFNWSENNYAQSIKEPVIHSLNKDETIVKDFPDVYKKIINRKNVLLLGDSIHDIDMLTGFDYDNLIKIGFLNYNDPELKILFTKNFDIIITADGNFDYVNDLIKKICLPL